MKSILKFLLIKPVTKEELAKIPPMTQQSWIFKILGTLAYLFIVSVLLYGVFVKHEYIGIVGLVGLSCFHVGIFELWYYKKFY